MLEIQHSPSASISTVDPSVSLTGSSGSRYSVISDVHRFLNLAKLQPNQCFNAAAVIDRLVQHSDDVRGDTELLSMMLKHASTYTLETPTFSKFLDAIAEGAIRNFSDNSCFIDEALLPPDKAVSLQKYIVKLEKRKADAVEQSLKLKAQDTENTGRSKTPESGYVSSSSESHSPVLMLRSDSNTGNG